MMLSMEYSFWLYDSCVYSWEANLLGSAEYGNEGWTLDFSLRLSLGDLALNSSSPFLARTTAFIPVFRLLGCEV